MRYEGDPEGALVQFSSPAEAKKAHSSTEAVLNNRFIRIYFLRKDHVSVQAPLTEVTLEVSGVPFEPPIKVTLKNYICNSRGSVHAQCFGACF